MRKHKQQIGKNALRIIQEYFPGVTSVSDAAKSVVIEVTPNDSTNSIALDHKKCALAVACKRKLEADGALVGTKTAYIVHGHKALRFKLLESTSREIVSFDRNAGFAPGEYELKAPTGENRLGCGGEGRHGNGKHKRRRFTHFTANIRTALR